MNLEAVQPILQTNKFWKYTSLDFMKLYQEALAHPAVRWPVIIWPPANPAVLVWLERKLSLDISEVCLKAASL